MTTENYNGVIAQPVTRVCASCCTRLPLAELAQDQAAFFCRDPEACEGRARRAGLLPQFEQDLEQRLNAWPGLVSADSRSIDPAGEAIGRCLAAEQRADAALGPERAAWALEGALDLR